jgi:hypothetical protein
MLILSELSFLLLPNNVTVKLPTQVKELHSPQLTQKNMLQSTHNANEKMSAGKKFIRIRDRNNGQLNGITKVQPFLQY